MQDRAFKLTMLLIIVLPVLVTMLGLTLLSPPQQSVSVSGHAVRMQSPLAQNAVPLAIAFFMGMVAITLYYAKSSLGWLSVLVFPLVMSVLGVKLIGVKLSYFFVLNFALALALTFIVLLLFYNRKIMRLRMLITSLIAGAALTLYFRGIYFVKNQALEEGFWSQRFVSSVIVMILISFGMSLADLIIIRSEVKTLRNLQETEEEDDADDA
ncbi:MAG: hypothetical protein Q8M98_03855 [Candidatus Cloacimonadaceae bacterium]|nr:hypothetical protein [Candidatus Cloacimonadaceae bacterium]MDP3113892.1 hypothetical protein [Candidatus Cloacimonadaceae bacterium]